MKIKINIYPVITKMSITYIKIIQSINTSVGSDVNRVGGEKNFFRQLSCHNTACDLTLIKIT